MTDLDAWKEIVRAVSNVPSDRISQSLARVREILARHPESKALDPERKAGVGRNRMYIGGIDRGDEGDAA